MAKYNVKGNEMFEELCKELSVPFKRNGSLVLAFDDEDMKKINNLYINGNENGVKGLKILNRDEVLKMEPNLNKNIKGALFAPTGGIVGPFEYTLALVENGVKNGGEILLNSEVKSIKKDCTFAIETTDGKEVTANYVINAAGVYADKIHNSTEKINFRNGIRTFAGLRAIPDTDDFIIEEDKEIKGFIDVAGIKSPGLSSAPAIAEDVVNILMSSGLTLKRNVNFQGKREQIYFSELSNEEKAELIKKEPSYGRVICRCEGITEGEIVSAIKRSFGKISIDGVKRRCRPGMGRCQGGFCGPRVQEIIARELNIKMEEIVQEKEKSVYAINTVDGYMAIKAKAIILSMGCRERTRGAIGIPGDRPSGVLTAGAAQRYINMEGYMPGKEVVILGSGDIGLIMARRMSLEGAKVKAVVELMPYSNGLNRNIVQCLNDYHIPLYLSHTVVDIVGKDRLRKVVIAKVDEQKKPIKGTEIEFKVDTLLLSVGLIPENELSSKAGIEQDKRTNGLMVNESMETSMEGVFACGNVLHVHDLVDFVSEEAKRAGRCAAKYLKGQLNNEAYLNIKNGQNKRS